MVFHSVIITVYLVARHAVLSYFVRLDNIVYVFHTAVKQVQCVLV